MNKSNLKANTGRRYKARENAITVANHKDKDSPMNQSKLKANAGRRYKARENAITPANHKDEDNPMNNQNSKQKPVRASFDWFWFYF